jgi:hypothetical protein
MRMDLQCIVQNAGWTLGSSQLWGSINEIKVMVWWKMRASHNIIDDKLVRELSSIVKKDQVMCRHKTSCQGVCKGVEMQLQNLPVQQNFSCLNFELVRTQRLC